MKSLLRQLS